MTLEIEPIGQDFAAVARGPDLALPLSDADRDDIVRAMDLYAVLVFPGQPLSQEQLVGLGSTFGPLDSSLQKKMTQRVQDRLRCAAITDISNVDASGNVAEAAHKQAIMNVGNRFWHTDSAYDRHPFHYSILSAKTAVSWGGATEFADLRAAWDSLDDRTRDYIEGRTATFYSHFTRQWLGIEDGPEELRTYPPVRWPLVRTHAGSGRKLIWCDSKVCEISGMSIPEGRALAHELIEHIGQREHVYKHVWQPDDVVFWDNRAVLHRGRRFDLSERREMRRVSTIDDATALSQASFDVALPAGWSARGA